MELGAEVHAIKERLEKLEASIEAHMEGHRIAAVEIQTAETAVLASGSEPTPANVQAKMSESG
jgi:hypothetical protein